MLSRLWPTSRPLSSLVNNLAGFVLDQVGREVARLGRLPKNWAATPTESYAELEAGGASQHVMDNPEDLVLGDGVEQ